MFVTWRLWGSLPQAVLVQLREHADRERAKVASQEGEFLVTRRSTGNYGSPASRIAAKEFLRVDKLLDRAAAGPVWLKDERIAPLVVESLGHAAKTLESCELHAYVVMANHVHILITPREPIARITKSIKSYSARKANAILRRTGTPFWQDESFDHWVRSEASFWRIKDYIERNPVKAGLVSKPEDWPWSSAAQSP